MGLNNLSEFGYNGPSGSIPDPNQSGVKTMENATLVALENAMLVAVSKMDSASLLKLNETCNLSGDDHYAYQESKSLAYAMGKISQDVATYLYRSLGQTSIQFNKQPLNVRLTVIQIMAKIATM
jgi:hypothetical protein